MLNKYILLVKLEFFNLREFFIIWGKKGYEEVHRQYIIKKKESFDSSNILGVIKSVYHP